MMELKSSSSTTTTTVNETWKLCTLGGFLGFFVIILFLTSSPQTVQFTSSRTSTFIAFFTSPTTSSSSSSSSFNISSSPPPIAAVVVDTVVLASTNSTTSTVSTTGNNNNTDNNSTNSQQQQRYTDNTVVDTSQNSSNIEDSNIPIIPLATTFPSSSSSPLLPSTTKVVSSPTTRNVELPASGGQQQGVTISDGKDKSSMSCNMFEGKWVYRPNVSPMYRVEECPFLEEKMSCRRNGRPDSEYEGWSWEATDCDIPLFNGKDMLERLRGKRVIIAGDSLNRNQWESMACLIYASLHPSRVFVEAEGSLYKVLKALDYGFTLEFFWSPFLVFLDETNKSGRKVLNLDSLVPSSVQWRGAHVMIFNSGHWWTHRDVWDVYQYKGETIQDMPKELAYERALTTWSNWLTKNVNPNTTTVFFRSISPEHKGKYWCLNATSPITDDSYINNFPKSMIQVAEQQVTTVKQNNGGTVLFPVTYLNITALSGYRKDAHPAVYRYKAWQKKLAVVKAEMFADCSHWCLPGLPDTWNRLVYATLVGGGGGDERKKVVTGMVVSGGGGNVTDGMRNDDDVMRIEEERKS